MVVCVKTNPPEHLRGGAAEESTSSPRQESSELPPRPRSSAARAWGKSASPITVLLPLTAGWGRPQPLQAPDGTSVGCLPQGKAFPASWPLGRTVLHGHVPHLHPQRALASDPSSCPGPQASTSTFLLTTPSSPPRVPPAFTASVAHFAPFLPLLAVSLPVSTFLLPCLCQTFKVALWDG